MAQLQTVIQIRNLQKTLGSKQVLKNISLDIYNGEIIGVIGASGAGKTTLFRTLVGFYVADQGDIWFEGKNIKTDVGLIRTIIGFTSQEGCFYEELTSLENLRYFGELYGLDESLIAQRSARLLELVELSGSANVIARNLSGGMKKRLDVAIALIHDPRVLIMDEPTTGLDNKLRKSMWQLIERINKSGTTIILSSHIMEDLEHLCNRVCMLFSGQLVVCAAPAQLKQLYSRNEEIHLESYPGNYHKIIMEIKRLGLPLSLYAFHEHKLVLYTPQAEIMLKTVLDIMSQQNERLMDVDVNRPSLNEVFEAFSQYYNQGKNNPITKS